MTSRFGLLAAASSGVCDTSEYSWDVPYAILWVTMAPAGVGWHNWIIASCAGSSIGKKTMKHRRKDPCGDSA